MLLGQISDFYSQMPYDRFLLEQWIRRFGKYLSLPSGQIALMVRTSYLFEVGRLRDRSTAADDFDRLNPADFSILMMRSSQHHQENRKAGHSPREITKDGP